VPRKLIIGVEDTDQGRDALALGGALAEALAATPVVATALPYPSGAIGPYDLETALRASAEGVFRAARDRLDPLDPETRAIASRSPAEALCELALQEDAVAIVVGSTRRGAIGRVLPGSVGANLLHGAPCAVAIAPRDYAEATERRLGRIGLGFDGSAEAWAALETATGLTRRLHGALTLVTAVEPPGYGFGEALSVLSAGEIHTHQQREKRKVLDLGLARVPGDVRVDGRLMNGEAADAIAKASEEFDLLFLGSRGYGPLRRTVLGSVAAAVMTAARCPVLIQPRAAGADPLGLADLPADVAMPNRLRAPSNLGTSCAGRLRHHAANG
jgi:nucleotide-binding universal stress UspA family protein